MEPLLRSCVFCLLIFCSTFGGGVSAFLQGLDEGTGLGAAEPQVALFCGKVNMHMDVRTGKWEPDPSGVESCFRNTDEILNYCQKVYPDLQITSVLEATRPVTIDNWCRKSRRKCKGHQRIVVPYRCIAGEYVSEALLVPDKCKFLHQEKMDSCESYMYWHSVGKQACGAEFLELHSYGMLLPCGTDRFRGVEYVCCPSRSPLAKTEEATPSAFWKTDDRVKLEQSDEVEDSRDPNFDAVEVGDDEDDEDDEEDDGDDDDDDDDGMLEGDEGAFTEKYPEFADDWDTFPNTWGDYFVEPGYYDDSVTETTITTTTQTMEDEMKVTPTPRPTDGVDVYFETPGDESEHANFMRAKMDLEERRMRRINEVMKEWAEADNQAKNLPKADRQALNEHFQSILQTLEDQVAVQRQRLVETHLARVVAILNDNRRVALESYLSAVQADPPQPERVFQALKRYVRAEQKDKRHTLRHYQHVMTVDPEKAEHMKFQVYTHLKVIEERMNQSLALLYKVTRLADELHDEIQELLQSERSDSTELLTTSYSETKTTEEFLPMDSEEDAGGERNSDKEDSRQEDKKASGVAYEDYTVDDTGAGYEYMDKVNISADIKQVVYKASDMQRDELEPDAILNLNRGALIGLLVVALAVAMVIVISLMMVRRRPYGTISHGIVEVDPMLTPEERQLSKMQNHGYENPTYKFFEQVN
ncbi:amyloid beta precursor like protein 2 [Latimeria chalumnae]